MKNKFSLSVIICGMLIISSCEKEENLITQDNSNEISIKKFKENLPQDKTVHKRISIHTGKTQGGWSSPGSNDANWDVLLPGASNFVDAKVSTGKVNKLSGIVRPMYTPAPLGMVAKWITPYIYPNNHISPFQPVGNYVYRRKFYVECQDFQSISIFMLNIKGDDEIIDIKVNGTTISPWFQVHPLRPNRNLTYNVPFINDPINGDPVPYTDGEIQWSATVTPLCFQGYNTLEITVKHILQDETSFQMHGTVMIDYDDSCFDDGPVDPGFEPG